MTGVDQRPFSSETRALRSFVSERLVRQAGRRPLPKISVVIPSFNQARYIERTLLSVLNQNYPNIEIIVVDGGSSDGTVALLERYRGQLAYVHSGPDKGQSDALNHGFAQATGDIFAWLNSDDVYLPGTLAAVAEAFMAFPKANVVFGDWWSIDADDQVIEVNYAFDFNLNHFIYEGFHLNSQAMFWRGSAHRRFGNFDLSLHRTMDYDLILRLGMNEGQDSFVRLERALACFRRHPLQKTTDSGADIVLKEHKVIAAKNGIHAKFRNSGCVLRLIYRARRAWWYRKRGGVRYIWTRMVHGPLSAIRLGQFRDRARQEKAK